MAIVYHNDNEAGIPHARLVVNCTNLRTGAGLQTPNPLELNRALQDMARERGLSSLSNEMPEKRAHAIGQDVYRSRLEAELAAAGGYLWVSDIHSRISIAKGLARSEAEFREVLEQLGVAVSDNSAKPKLRSAGSSAKDADKNHRGEKRPKRSQAPEKAKRCGCSHELALRLQKSFSRAEGEADEEEETNWMGVMDYKDID